MARKKHTLDRELRHELSKAQCHELMDYLMVQFVDTKDIHFNYYFDTPEYSLAERDITFRLRTIRKENAVSYQLTLKIPTIDLDTYLEYNQSLSEKQMRLLVYNNQLPDGEIKDLNSIHGGHVKNVNMIRVNRVTATYRDIEVYFDKISHRGKTYYEVGTRIDSTLDKQTKEKHMAIFKDLLASYNIKFSQAKRRSKKYR